MSRNESRFSHFLWSLWFLATLISAAAMLLAVPRAEGMFAAVFFTLAAFGLRAAITGYLLSLVEEQLWWAAILLGALAFSQAHSLIFEIESSAAVMCIAYAAAFLQIFLGLICFFSIKSSDLEAPLCLKEWLASTSPLAAGAAVVLFAVVFILQGKDTEAEKSLVKMQPRQFVARG